ncbi:MAG TPA: SDR family oxidoreductase [Steroidobacteraceae bacterium]|nr:SDR family oxidoreductase [Steroidobacteraceae bacterium]
MTGAARGIGQSLCRAFAQSGARVVGVDLESLQETGALVRSDGGDWMEALADVAEPSQVAAVADRILGHFGHCDVLVNNAGIYPLQRFEQATFELWRRVLAVNLDSQFLCSRAFAHSMIERRWGRIINMTSSSVQVPNSSLSAYKASKMGVIGLTRGMAADLGPYGITVNAVSPSLTRTPGVLENPAISNMLEGIAQVQAIKRIALPQDITALVLFLASHGAEFITGQTIVADGGLTYF